MLTSGQAVERDLTDPHGKSFFLRLLPYRAKGVVDGVVLTLIDVTGLKTAEDALFHERYLLNSLLRTVPDAIYFKDARGRYIRCNHAMAARLGVQDAADAIGKTAFDMPEQDAAMAMHREDEAVLRVGQPQHYRLERRTDQDGAEAWDMVTRLPLLDRSNATVGVIAIFRDVTEQVRAKAKIDDEVRRRDQFLAMLSHELRNPLGAVVSATATLKAADTQDHTHARSIDVLERQSRHMARLLDDLLDASRVTQNKIELRRRVVDLRVVASEAADAVRPQAQERDLELTLDLAAATALGARRRDPAATDSDQSPDQCRQVHATRRPRDAHGRTGRQRCGGRSGQRQRRRHPVADAGLGLRPVRSGQTYARSLLMAGSE